MFPHCLWAAHFSFSGAKKQIWFSGNAGVKVSVGYAYQYFRSIILSGGDYERGTILANPFNTQSVPHFYLDRKKINRFVASSSFVHFLPRRKNFNWTRNEDPLWSTANLSENDSNRFFDKNASVSAFKNLWLKSVSKNSDKRSYFSFVEREILNPKLFQFLWNSWRWIQNLDKIKSHPTKNAFRGILNPMGIPWWDIRQKLLDPNPEKSPVFWKILKSPENQKHSKKIQEGKKFKISENFETTSL